MSVFNITGYHLDLYCIHTSKYQGSIDINPADYPSRPHGYAGRKEEFVNATFTKYGKTISHRGWFITEIIPVCGKIKGATLADRIQVIKEHYQKQPYGRQKRG